MNAEDRARLIRVKIERAKKHVDDLEAAVVSLGEPSFNTISLEFEPGTGETRLESRPLHIYGPDIPTIAGDAIHNLRCALDHLAFQLVTVGITFGEQRVKPWQDIQFPIFNSPGTYESRKARCVEGARKEAVDAIDRLKPYKGGNEPLWLLRQLDNTDKHSFILATGEDVIVGGVPLKTYEPYFTSIGIPKDDEDVNLTSDTRLVEPAVGRANALLPTLHKLTQLVSKIVMEFQPLLQDNLSKPDFDDVAIRPNAFLEWLENQKAE
jgi:hypothetical protein